MSGESAIRTRAHQMIDHMSVERIEALLDLLDEDLFSEEEKSAILEAQKEDHWTEWRKVRKDV